MSRSLRLGEVVGTLVPQVQLVFRLPSKYHGAGQAQTRSSVYIDIYMGDRESHQLTVTVDFFLSYHF